MKPEMSRFIGALLIPVALVVVLGGCGLNKSPEERIQEALAYEQAGEYRAAEIELKNALTADPENSQGRLVLGRVLYAQGQLQAAEKELRRAMDLGVEPTEYGIVLGKVLRDQGKAEELLVLMNETAGKMAGQEYERLVLIGGGQLGVGQKEAGEASLMSALEMRSDVAEPWILLARSARSAGDYEAWKSRIGNAIDAEPQSPGVWLEKAGAEASMGKTEDALESYGRVLVLTESDQDSSNRLSALMGLADQALTARDQARAEELISLVPEKFAGVPTVRFMQARLELEKGNFDVAESIFNEVQTLVPSHSGAAYYLAAINLEQGKYVQAESRLAELLLANPSNLAAKRLMAIVRVKLDDPDKAAADIDSLLSAGYTDSYLTSLVGGELLRRGDVNRAVDYLRMSADAAPDDPGVALELATGLIAQRQYPGAIEVLEAVSAQGALEARRHAMLALAYNRNGNAKKAKSAAEAALATEGVDAVSMNLAGEYYAIVGNVARAREILLAAAQKDKSNPRSQFSLAVLAFKEGDKDAARKSLERVIEIDPDHTRALTALAQLAMEAGQSAEGLDFLKQANGSDPGALVPAAMLARFYIGSGRAQGALELIAPALSRNPDDERLLSLQAAALLATGKPDQAVTTLEKIQRQNPGNQEVLMQLASAQVSAGLTSRAKDTLENAVGFDRRNVRAILMLAVVEDRLENSPRSQALVKEARTLEPDNPASYVVEGDILGRHEQLAESYAAYQEAAKRGTDRGLVLKLHRAERGLGKTDADQSLLDWLAKLPSDVAIRSVLAQYYLDKAMYKESVREYRLLVDAAPNNGAALNNLAWSLFKLGDPEARKIAQRAADANPDNAFIADTLGWILANSGDLAEGERLIRFASQKAPADPDIAYHLAFVLAKTSQLAEARQILNKILADGAGFTNRQGAEALMLEIKGK